MASTNKTDTLELSQFIDTDKPAWLTDYNNDMKRINDYCKDMHTAADELSQLVQDNAALEAQHYEAVMTAIGTIDTSITGLTTALAALTTRVTVNETNITTLQTQMAQALSDIEGLKSGANIGDGVIVTRMLADHCVTTDKLAPNSVTTDEILNGTIQYEDLSQTDCLPDIKQYVNS